MKTTHDQISLGHGGELTRLVTEKVAAPVLGVSPSWLQKNRCRCSSPVPFVKLPTGAVRYRLQDLTDYIEACRAASSLSRQPKNR